MVTSEPTQIQTKAFRLELPPEPRVYNRPTVWMVRIVTANANPGPTKLVKFRLSLPILLGDWTVSQVNGGP